MIPCRHPPCPMATDPALGFANEKSRNSHEYRYHNELKADMRHDAARGRKLRVAIYARVSTDQGEQDPEQQMNVCRREAETRGYEIVWEGHDMVTGDSHIWERESGNKLWALLKEGGKVDVLMTYDASRLSRQHPVSVFKVLQLLQKYGVYYVSATEGHFDFTEENEFREVIIFMTSWMNNWFLRNLSKTTRRGKEAAIRAGRKQGAHRKGCGRDFACPTNCHDKTGRNVRAPQRISIAKSMARQILPLAAGSGPEANPTPEIGGDE